MARDSREQSSSIQGRYAVAHSCLLCTATTHNKAGFRFFFDVTKLCGAKRVLHAHLEYLPCTDTTQTL